MFSLLLGLSLWFDQLPYIHLFQPRYKYGTHINECATRTLLCAHAMNLQRKALQAVLNEPEVIDPLEVLSSMKTFLLSMMVVVSVVGYHQPCLR